MKRPIRIQFCDFWGDFKKDSNLFLDLLKPYYDPIISDNPEVLIYSCYGRMHEKFKCHKIFYTPENVSPDYRVCDFALSFEYADDERNLRIPLYRWKKIENLTHPKNVSQIFSEKTKFCCTLVSNPKGAERNRFFDLLSKYKKVDSGGSFQNNIGYNVSNKMEFIKEYKFVFAFENSFRMGYTTEKIVEPMFENSIPIYWGNPGIHRDFNRSSFINVHDYKTFDDVVAEIIRIDQDDEAFCKYLEEPFFNKNKVPEELDLLVISNKLNIGIQNMLKKLPVSKAPLSHLYLEGKYVKKKVMYYLFKKHIW